MARTLRRDIPAGERLIFALDVGSSEEALGLVEQLSPAVSYFKVGMPLFFREGWELIDRITDAGPDNRVFLDLKLLDIPETVDRTLEFLASKSEQIVFATIHVFNRGLKEAVRIKGEFDLNVLVVTVMTSWDEEDLRSSGVDKPLPDHVSLLTKRALDHGKHRSGAHHPHRLVGRRAADQFGDSGTE